MQKQQSSNHPRTTLTKNLTFNETQAFEGAKNFYYCFIPTIMVGLLIGHLYILELHLKSQKPIEFASLFGSFVVIVCSFVFYFLALRVYRQCNEVDTTPVLKQIQISDSVVEKETSEEGQHALLGGRKPKRQICRTCNIICDYRTKHCKKCQVCIQRFDHHCFWIGNCVGRHNHLPFYLFLFYQTTNNLLNLVLLDNLRNYLEFLQVEVHSLISWSILSLEVFDFGFIVFTGYLLIYHTMLISNGITTWEQMRRTRISYLKYLPPGYNPFSSGIVSNWKVFFSEPTRAKGIPTIQDWQPSVPTFEESQLIEPVFNLIQNQYYSCC